MSQGITGDPKGPRHGSTPLKNTGPSSGLSCAWGPGQKYFGIGGGMYQGCSPSGTSHPCRNGAYYTSCHLSSSGSDYEGNSTVCPPKSPSTFLLIYPIKDVT